MAGAQLNVSNDFTVSTEALLEPKTNPTNTSNAANLHKVVQHVLTRQTEPTTRVSHTKLNQPQYQNTKSILDGMTDRSAAQTPLEQIQHNPPSLPASPLPKRIKRDNQDNSTPEVDTPTMPTSYNRTPADDSGLLPPIGTAPNTSGKGGPADESGLLPPIPFTPNTTSNGTNPADESGLLPPVPSLPGVSSLLPNTASPPSQFPVPPLLCQKLTKEATAPTRGSAFAAGYDLYASAPCTLKSKSKALISTGLAIAVPPGTYGRVAPRSGLASKHFLDTGAGVIDADYRGEVKVLMFNFSDVDYEVKVGERVAQLVLERIVTPEVQVVEKLEESVRGAGGFGSTGYI